ncbi:hypothetical protein [Streptomyces filamentosus]|uniref:hypothetical protein n=1 Tax=Streptomyces filamentosus TaxID=67294 RepID=UPI001239E19C|nr:hypothetical protein [Streptomyces filamentosus]KAA6218487.1 hypothetical protein CP979_17385 [Streptomyces filamentosus]
MHTTVTPFTLRPWREGKGYGRRTGWRGTSAEFGEVTVEAPLRQAVPETLVSELRGGLLPEASYETRGVHTDVVRLPTLNRATLRLGDALVAVERNRLGLTARQRGLRLRHGGDAYRLWAGNRRSWTLVREADAEDPGVRVAVRGTGRLGGRRLEVTVTGRALPADLALALVFAGVDRAALTRGGAVRAALSRATGFWAESQY